MTSDKYFAYVRKSTEGEERQALSIESQTDKIKSTFPRLNIELLVERKSAFEPNNRPVFDDMIKRIDDGKAKGVICWHPDRLSRNELDASAITYRLRKHVIKDMRFVSYNYDNSPEGIMMLQMALSQSQYYSAKLSKDVIRGNDTKLKNGGFPGVAPNGYINNKINKTVEPDSDRFDLVRQMWDLMLTGSYSVPQVLNTANNEWGYRTLKKRNSGGGRLSRSALYGIFNNPFYAGVIVRKGEEYDGVHQQMITMGEFEQVQRILGSKSTNRLSRKNQFPYRGPITCGECGCQFTASVSKGHVYYYCTKKKKDIDCQQNYTIREEDIEQQLVELTSKYTILPEFETWALEALKNENKLQSKLNTTKYDMQHKAVKSNQAQIDKLIDLATKELISDEQFATKSKGLKVERKELTGQLRDTEDHVDQWHDVSERMIDIAANARSRLKHGTLKQRRDVLIGLGTNPTIVDKQFTIDVNEFLVPIGEHYAELEAQYKKVKTEKTVDSEELDEAVQDIRSVWLPLVDALRNDQCDDYSEELALCLR